jgi:hypothetical protein
MVEKVWLGEAQLPKRSVVVTSVVVVLLLGVVALSAYQFGRSRTAGPGTSAPPSAAGGGAAKQLTIWLTGYSWQDNTPPGSSVVGEPVLHQKAGGSGTFADPITVAVPGHQGDMDWPPGTKFYLPSVQRYVIVEDSGAAKPPSGDDTHLDMWIGGQDGTKDTTDECESQLTGNVPAQVNPPDNLPVMAGPIFGDQRCNIPPQSATKGTYKGDEDDEDGGGHHHHHHHSDDSGDGGN